MRCYKLYLTVYVLGISNKRKEEKETIMLCSSSSIIIDTNKPQNHMGPALLYPRLSNQPGEETNAMRNHGTKGRYDKQGGNDAGIVIQKEKPKSAGRPVLMRRNEIQMGFYV